MGSLSVATRVREACSGGVVGNRPPTSLPRLLGGASVIRNRTGLVPVGFGTTTGAQRVWGLPARPAGICRFIETVFSRKLSRGHESA